MSTPVKLLLRWDVQPGAEADYSEFIVNEFIPRMNRLGVSDVQFWYTSFGECEKIQVELLADQQEKMTNILRSDEWSSLNDRLGDLVVNFSQKTIRATGGFQL